MNGSEDSDQLNPKDRLIHPTAEICADTKRRCSNLNFEIGKQEERKGDELRCCDETMSLESIVAGDLRIRLIDARELLAEAKEKNGVVSSTMPTETKDVIIRSAIDIFNSKPSEVQENMRRMQMVLDCLATAEAIVNGKEDNYLDNSKRGDTTSFFNGDISSSSGISTSVNSLVAKKA